MSPTKRPEIAWSQKLPDSVLKNLSLQTVDFGDIYTLSIPSADRDTNTSAEQWARAILGDVPSVIENFVWHWLLRFPLHREKSPTTIAGWRIGGRGEDDWIRIENWSWLMRANILVLKRPGEVSLATVLEYRSPVSSIWWWVLSWLHRRGAPGLLWAGEQKLRKQSKP